METLEAVISIRFSLSYKWECIREFDAGRGRIPSP
jgi:hypothetical protein